MNKDLQMDTLVTESAINHLDIDSTGSGHQKENRSSSPTDVKDERLPF